VNHQDLTQLFRDQFLSEPDIVAVAPGRVNLIGEHTDYNDGFVFPAAIDKQVSVALKATDGSSKLYSAQLGDGQEFDAETVVPGEASGWVAYAAGMAWVLRERTTKPMPNIQAVVASTVPMGSGISSSAAIEMAFGVAWNRLAELGLDNKSLALLAQKCENQFVGVNCGIMDQMASAMGQDAKAMFIDTRTLDIEYASIPEGLRIVICDTKKPRALSDSAYNERRSQCEQAAQILNVPALRDAKLADLEKAKDQMTDTVYRRARHVVSEDERCLEFRGALDRNDRKLIGDLMRASHESLRDDYEVSCKELDAMAEACWSAPGCVGARMTGAGFGGACVALVEGQSARAFSDYVNKAYQEATGVVGSLTVCNAVRGAHVGEA
jgi:galactokinase